MKLYFSGSLTRSSYRQIEQLIKYNGYRLCTYAYPNETYVYLDIADELGYKANMMIDSGAFTAFTKGKPVQLPKLLAYSKRLIEKYGDRHDFVFIGLDIIPPKNPTETDLKKGMKQSYENFLVQQQELAPYPVLPVYHSSEPVSLRNLYLKHTDHIALSMNQAMAEKHRVDWATRVQVPDVKMHGLAATGVQMIRYVDWYSVDSAAWIMIAAMGGVYWPTEDGNISLLPISAQSPKVKRRNTHAMNFTMTNEIKDTIESKNYKVEDLMYDYSSRMSWNLDVWVNHPWVRTPLFQQGLFSD